MHIYETTYILHPALQEGRLKDIISAIENKIKSLGAEILYSDNWGRKKLSYLINKEKYGTYMFLQFKLSNSDKLKDLSSEFEHNPNILRSLIVKIDEVDVFDKNQQEEEKKEFSKIEKESKAKDEKLEENLSSEKKEISKTDKNSKDENLASVKKTKIE